MTLKTQTASIKLLTLGPNQIQLDSLVIGSTLTTRYQTYQYLTTYGDGSSTYGHQTQPQIFIPVLPHGQL
jgi:hypothetical protein